MGDICACTCTILPFFGEILHRWNSRWRGAQANPEMKTCCFQRNPIVTPTTDDWPRLGTSRAEPWIRRFAPTPKKQRPCGREMLRWGGQKLGGKHPQSKG